MELAATGRLAICLSLESGQFTAEGSGKLILDIHIHSFGMGAKIVQNFDLAKRKRRYLLSEPYSLF